MPGDVLEVKDTGTPYLEKLTFTRSGNATDGFITLQAFPGHTPILDGTGVPGDHMVLIESQSYVKLIGFEIRNHLQVNDGSGVRITGSGAHIEIRQNRIHDVRGVDAMGITVYGTSPTAPLSDLVIDGNEIYDIEPAHSEALTLNGNIERFAVTNNIVRDVNNIGIDFIGGEVEINSDPTKVPRDGVCRFNHVFRARANYGGGFAAGIYVDGGRDILVENNVVSGSDMGIEVGAENAGVVASGIIVRNNRIYRNDKVCLVFGGFDASAGRVRTSQFVNNTCYQNDTLGTGVGELWIQHAEQNTVRRNIFYGLGDVLLSSDTGSADNIVDANVWFTSAGAEGATFVWNGTTHEGFSAYQAASGQDAQSRFADPLLVDPTVADFHLRPGSPAIDGGDAAGRPGPGELDIDRGARLMGPGIDVGADEVVTPGCEYTTDPAGASVPRAGGSGTVTVTTLAGCNWTATGFDAWVTVDGATRTGTDTVDYSVEPSDAGPSSRIATLVIATTRFTVAQLGASTTPLVTITSPTDRPAWKTTTNASQFTVSGMALDNDAVASVSWSNDRGGSGDAMGTDTWTVANIPLQEGFNAITLSAMDADGNRGTDTLTVNVNRPPSVTASCDPCALEIGATADLRAEGQDPDSDSIAYQWSADTGSFEGSTTDETARWRAPDHAGAVPITVTVTDGRGGTASTSVTIDVSVAQLAQGPIGQPTAGLLLSPSTIPRR